VKEIILQLAVDRRLAYGGLRIRVVNPITLCTGNAIAQPGFLPWGSSFDIAPLLEIAPRPVASNQLHFDLKRGPYRLSVGNNIILQYIALLGVYYTSAILRIAISYWPIYRNIAIAIEQYIAI
jgi:hypothetical protein